MSLAATQTSLYLHPPPPLSSCIATFAIVTSTRSSRSSCLQQPHPSPTQHPPAPAVPTAPWPAASFGRPSIVSLLRASPLLGRRDPAANPVLTAFTSPPAGHVFGKSTRKEFCYDNLHISRNAWDTNLVKVRTTPSDATNSPALPASLPADDDDDDRSTPSTCRSIGTPPAAAPSL